MLSVTIAAWQQLPQTGFDAVDWVNIMSYDNPGRHSTLEAAQADVKKLLAAGAPARKITLGLPLYGRDVTKPDRVMTYREIVAKHRPGPEVDEIDQIYFNGAGTIRQKTDHALKNNLAGVMVWELGQDAPGDRALLKVIRAAVDAAHRE